MRNLLLNSKRRQGQGRPEDFPRDQRGPSRSRLPLPCPARPRRWPWAREPETQRGWGGRMGALQAALLLPAEQGRLGRDEGAPCVTLKAALAPLCRHTPRATVCPWRAATALVAASESPATLMTVALVGCTSALRPKMKVELFFCTDPEMPLSGHQRSGQHCGHWQTHT